MDGFEAALDDLLDASKKVSEAADVVAGVRDSVKGMDLHAEPPRHFGDISGLLHRRPATAFGDSLGMSSVAYAYDQHRRRAADKLEELRQNTEATAHALGRVAELYEESDTIAQSHLTRLHKSM
ncbi:hypothetical protein [Amycolatopsis taiwanensis]|uniref:hypothetical protein n=1 Tax=Amycolatopsis taiwanensis TaxID=342230 RepID=UPI0004800EF9|nr:hypothetical protein [Amycolatopsis taiwanensis]